MIAREFDTETAVHRTQQMQVGAARNELLDQFQVGRIVFHIKHRAWRCPRLRRGLRPQCLISDQGNLSCRRQIQFHPENTSHPDSTLRANHASHQLNQPLGYHQTDASTFLHATLLAETIKRLEKLRKLLRGQPLAGVADADAHEIGWFHGALHDHRPTRLVVLDGVGKEVKQNLFYPLPIGVDKGRGFETGKRQADTPRLRLRLDQGAAFAQDLHQRDRLPRQSHLTRLDQRQIEDFVDQLE